jgi:predicted transcriptional regulator
MMNTAKQLDDLVAKVRTLPTARQQEVIAVLHDIVAEPYELSENELAILRPAMAEALAGQHLVDADADEVLTKPWC